MISSIPTKEKTYSTKSGVKQAVKNQGLYLMDHSFERNENGRWYVCFVVDVIDDAIELSRRGFRANWKTEINGKNL